MKLLDAVTTDTTADAVILESTRASFQVECSDDFAGTVKLQGALDSEDPIWSSLPVLLGEEGAVSFAEFTTSAGILNVEFPRQGVALRAVTEGQTAGSCTVVLSADLQRS